VTVDGDTITLLDLPIEVRTQRIAGSAPYTVVPSLSPADQVERRRILDALNQTGGNRTEAARLLGTSRVTLWKKIRKYAIDAGATSG
jgi:transcriptional regulator of acetoin/glycerol metabolism